MAWFKRFLFYLNPFSRDKNARKNLNLMFMHGINRISIYIFLIALVLVLIRYLSR